MGHSTDVPLGQRVSVWIELVPRILEHLGVEHVAFVSHSAGTIYLLNTLYHHRRLLHPEKPLVGLLGTYGFMFFFVHTGCRFLSSLLQAQ